MTGLLGTHVPQIFKLHKAMFLEFIELNVMKGNETRMQMGAASQAQNHVTSRSVRATCGFASYVISGRNCGSRLAAKRLKGIKKMPPNKWVRQQKSEIIFRMHLRFRTTHNQTHRSGQLHSRTPRQRRFPEFVANTSRCRCTFQL